MFLYLMWFGRKGQSPRCGQMQFVGDLLGLKVNSFLKTLTFAKSTVDS